MSLRKIGRARSRTGCARLLAPSTRGGGGAAPGGGEGWVGGRGIGVVGMCVTGNFALTLTLDPWVVAPVMGHPSLPLPLTRAKAAAVHVTPETFANARRRTSDEGLKVLGVRFHGDTLFCRAARFETLRRELGDGFEGIELPAASAKPQPEPPHSVLTIGLIDHEGEPTHEAVERVLSFLSDRLR